MKGAVGKLFNLRAWNGRFWRPVELDVATRSLVILSHPQHEAHQGDAYKVDITLASITSGQYLAIGFTTPAASVARVHLTFGFVAEAKAHIQLLEGPTNTPGSGVVGGTVIHDLYSFSDKRQTTVERDEEEWLLAPETAYAIKLVADANGGGQVLAAWSEHPHEAA